MVLCMGMPFSIRVSDLLAVLDQPPILLTGHQRTALRARLRSLACQCQVCRYRREHIELCSIDKVEDDELPF